MRYTIITPAGTFYTRDRAQSWAIFCAWIEPDGLTEVFSPGQIGAESNGVWWIAEALN